jgi:hypothetical protein
MLLWLQHERLRVDGRLRAHDITWGPLPRLSSHDGAHVLAVSMLEGQPPWSHGPAISCVSPSMLTDEERSYYQYVGRFYEGSGAVVELGPWLGCSTRHLLHGLRANPRFAGGRLYVFDAFVWHEYMAVYYDGPARPAAGESFRALFDRFTEDVAAHMEVTAVRIADEPGNLHLPPLDWTRGPIEMCAIDCGRTLEVNEAWYAKLAPHFIPGRTLIMMQDWGTHDEVPERSYNQTKIFTDRHADALRPVHELAHGDLATFLYCA